ncbi:MAG: LysR family transcriptional regulator [Allorhizobium sp.]
MLSSERLKGIDTFVEAANCGSFTAAAARLNLTNSAVSKSVARLEARLGRKLFERTTRRLALTDAGSAYYAMCVRVLADLSEAEAVLAAQETEPVGRLKINVPVAFGHMQVMPLILSLSQRHPNLHPDVSFTDRFVDVIEEGVDIAVRITSADIWPEALGRRYLGTERLVFCASPGFIERHGAPQSSDDLNLYDSVLYGKADGSTIPWRLAHDATSIERRVMDGRITVGSAEAQVRAVAAGFGIAQLATWLIEDNLKSGALVEILPQMATEGLPLHLVWPRSRQLSPKVDSMITVLAEGLRI